jgi:hypothetical protein
LEEREGERKFSAATDLIGSRNLSTMLLHNALTNGQAQPGSIATAAEAGLEDMVNLVRADTTTSVTEFDDHTLAAIAAALTWGAGRFALKRNSNTASCGRMTNGI